MRLTATAILAFAIFGIPGILAADDSTDNGPRSLENGRTNFYEDTVETVLAPRGSEFIPEIRSTLGELDPRVGIEIALSIPVTDEAFTPGGRLAIYNILRSLSTMEGLEYYSASRDEMRTFYHESYAIVGPEERSRIPDPTVSRIPASSRVWVFQRDGSFGSNVQELVYSSLDGSVLLDMRNDTTMTYKVFPLVRPGNLRTFVLLEPSPATGELQFYGNIAVRVPAMFGLQERARNSFYNRIVALYDWFAAEMEAAGLAQHS